MKKRVYNEEFKKMAVELSFTKSSVIETAAELGIDAGRLSKWRGIYKGDKEPSSTGLTADQIKIKKLEKDLKEAQLERDILKKAVSIFSRGDGKYTDS
jgi:transposase